MSKYPVTLKEVFNNFESIKQIDENGNEFWNSDDLQQMLGYTKKQKFEGVIKKAIKACEVSGRSVDDHFTASGKPIISGKGRVQEVNSYSFTKEAAYLVAQNGDSRKPEIGLAQLYFTDSTIDNEKQTDGHRLVGRIGCREEHKALTNTALDVGVRPNRLGSFHDVGQKGLNGGYSIAELKDRKGIPPNANYVDYMSSVELSANLLRMTLTTERLSQGDINTEKDAMDMHARIGKSVRNLVAEYSSVMPEDLPAIESS